MKAKLKTGTQAEPESLSDWIHHSHSLTDKLATHLIHVELERLSQQWVSPTWWDTYFLSINESILQREILIKSGNVPYWFARTVIPYACYALNPSFFNRLEKESLRNLIFYSDKLHKVQFKSYSVDKQCIEYHWVKKYMPTTIEGPLWVRCTEYSYQQQRSFFLTELLLPALLEVKS